MLQLAVLLGPATAGHLRASYTTLLKEHMSELMPVYLDHTKNSEWNQRMSTQDVLTSEHGPLVHQTYKLPWPLKARELLMHCDNHISHRAATVTAKCRSAVSSVAPVTTDAVRMEILESQWLFEALPGNGRMKTRVTVYILISDRFAVGIRARDPPLPHCTPGRIP